LDPNETLEKPPYSYASLVAQAIDSQEPVRGIKKLTSAAICEWISVAFPYYAKNPDGLGWQVRDSRLADFWLTRRIR
jgi:hypothetical protein